MTKKYDYLGDVVVSKEDFNEAIRTQEEAKELKSAFVDFYNFMQGHEMKQSTEMYVAIQNAKDVLTKYL